MVGLSSGRPSIGLMAPSEPGNGIMCLGYTAGNYTLYGSPQAAIKIKCFIMYSFISIQSVVMLESASYQEKTELHLERRNVFS